MCVCVCVCVCVLSSLAGVRDCQSDSYRGRSLTHARTLYLNHSQTNAPASKGEGTFTCMHTAILSSTAWFWSGLG